MGGTAALEPGEGKAVRRDLRGYAATSRLSAYMNASASGAQLAKPSTPSLAA
jgi:hypothetical protein